MDLMLACKARCKEACRRAAGQQATGLCKRALRQLAPQRIVYVLGCGTVQLQSLKRILLHAL